MLVSGTRSPALWLEDTYMEFGCSLQEETEMDLLGQSSFCRGVKLAQRRLGGSCQRSNNEVELDCAGFWTCPASASLSTVTAGHWDRPTLTLESVKPFHTPVSVLTSAHQALTGPCNAPLKVLFPPVICSPPSQGLEEKPTSKSPYQLLVEG